MLHKLAVIEGILSDVDMGSRRVEVGLMLRKAILVSSLLFTAEAWSGIKDDHLRRIEQVDSALLRSLMKCHSKTTIEFLHLESGTMKLRHILSLNRIMYHHHILQTDDDETIKKIYLKQKSDPTKNDWFCSLQKDFEFIGLNITDQEIQAIPRFEYKKKIKNLIQNAAFEYFLNKKRTHSKLNDVSYSDFKLQPYLQDVRFSKEERKLLTSLRSRCYNAKSFWSVSVSI